MVDFFQGEIIKHITPSGGKFHYAYIPCVLTKPKGENPIQTEFIIDTGAGKTVISHKLGIDLKLKAQTNQDTVGRIIAANGEEITYIVRKINMYIVGRGDIRKENVPVCWCIPQNVTQNFLGMDFLNDYKLIVIGGPNKRFYLTKIESCVGCKK